MVAPKRSRDRFHAPPVGCRNKKDLRFNVLHAPVFILPSGNCLSQQDARDLLPRLIVTPPTFLGYVDPYTNVYMTGQTLRAFLVFRGDFALHLTLYNRFNGFAQAVWHDLAAAA